MMLASTRFAATATSATPLGMDYSQWLNAVTPDGDRQFGCTQRDGVLCPSGRNVGFSCHQALPGWQDHSSGRICSAFGPALASCNPVRNSIATCLATPSQTGSLPTAFAPSTTVGTAPILTVVAPDGSVPQITCLPGRCPRGVDGGRCARGGVKSGRIYHTATNPAAPGSIVSVFATGLGPINPLPADGSLVDNPLPSNVVQAGVEAESYVVSPPFGLRLTSTQVTVTYAGPAPYLVAGISQVNFRIPLANTAIGFYLAPGGLSAIDLPASTTSQVFQVYAAGQ